MKRRVALIAFVVAATLLGAILPAAALLGIPAMGAHAATDLVMCPPVTIDTLFPGEEQPEDDEEVADEDAADEDPAPEDPAPEDPAPEDPAPEDPAVEEPTPQPEPDDAPDQDPPSENEAPPPVDGGPINDPGDGTTTTTTAPPPPDDAPPPADGGPINGPLNQPVPASDGGAGAGDETDESPIKAEAAATTEEPEKAEPESRAPACNTPFVYDMTYPVLGRAPMISFFGADRDGGRRRHKGIDVAAPKMAPVVAVSDGTVMRIRIEGRLSGNYVAIRHDDGWSSWYIHLNNDIFGTDNGRGTGTAPGLAVGDRVEAGQLIGWNGDSGNAESTPPHVHFELHMPSGDAIDAAPSLAAAQAALDDELTQPANWPFRDDDDSVHARLIGTLTSVGLVGSCDAMGLDFCPDEPATGGDAVAFLERAAGVTLDPTAILSYPEEPPHDLEMSEDFSSIIDGARGCGEYRFCENGPITAGEVAQLVTVALPIERRGKLLPVVAAGRPNDPLLAGLYATGVLYSCEEQPKPDVDPSRQVTRVELAEAVGDALGLLPATPCDATS